MFNVADEVPTMRVGRALALAGIAALAVLVLVAGYVYINRVPPTAEGELTAVWLYQPLPPPATADVPVSAVPRGNSLLLLVPVRVRNLSEKPLSVMDLEGVVTVGDTDYKSYAASTLDFDKVFQFYPDLDAYRQPALLPHSEIPPGGESRGMVVFNYALDEAQWNKANSFRVDVTFDTIPYILHLTWPTFPNHTQIAATVPAPPPTTAAKLLHKRPVTATP
jgi:hypothetical protein